MAFRTSDRLGTATGVASGADLGGLGRGPGCSADGPEDLIELIFETILVSVAGVIEQSKSSRPAALQGHDHGALERAAGNTGLDLSRHATALDQAEASTPEGAEAGDPSTARRKTDSRTAARRERARRRREAAEQEYRDEVHRQWRAAEAATNGFMLNRAGQRRGIDERSLFTGPESRVLKYASAELIDWFQSHPRPTRVSWFGSAPARRAHRAGRRVG